jgi:hypothetical protein
MISLSVNPESSALEPDPRPLQAALGRDEDQHGGVLQSLLNLRGPLGARRQVSRIARTEYFDAGQATLDLGLQHQGDVLV